MTFAELWTSVVDADSCEKLRRYLAEGGDVNVRDEISDWTLLHHACEHMNHEWIRELAKAGAELNAQCVYDGWTPLHFAVDIDIDSVSQATGSVAEFLQKVSFSTTRLLLALGADPNIRDHKGTTPKEMIAAYVACYGSSLRDRIEDCFVPLNSPTGSTNT